MLKRFPGDLQRAMIKRFDTMAKALGRTERDIVMSATGKPDAVRKMRENPNRLCRADAMLWLAQELGTTVEWLMLGTRTEPSAALDHSAAGAGQSRLVPVSGRAAAAIAIASPLPARPMRQVAVCGPMARLDGLYAMYVEGESMQPR